MIAPDIESLAPITIAVLHEPAKLAHRTRGIADMSLLHIIVLAVVQGLAELLPVSSSAHVIVAEKLLGLDPSKPEMTLLLVMLHTGTMFAVVLYFWRAWKESILPRRTCFGSRSFGSSSQRCRPLPWACSFWVSKKGQTSWVIKSKMLAAICKRSR